MQLGWLSIKEGLSRGASVCILLCAPTLAQADLVAVSAPDSVQAGNPFSLQVTLTCPPATEAPPPFQCTPGTDLSFVTFNASTIVPIGPSPAFYVLPGQPTVVPGFVLNVPGVQTIWVVPVGTLFPVGRASVVVQQPPSSVPSQSLFASLLLVLFILLAAAPNYSPKRTAANRHRVD